MLWVALDYAAYLVFRLLVAVVQAMPTDMADSLCRTLARLLAGPKGLRRKTFENNMRLVIPHATPQERQALCHAMWHHLLLMTCEIAWAARRLHLTNWSKIVRLRNNKLMMRALLSGRPSVIVTGHFGNFEIGGYLIGLMGFPTVTIARRLDNAPIHRFVERFRETHGQFMVEKEGCAPLIDKHLGQGGTLSILADQHAGDKGLWSDFLGVTASCHKALALFSLTSGAPMMVSASIRQGRPMYFEGGCFALADPRDDREGVCGGVKELTRWYNDRLGELVARAPEQYWWVHRRWRPKPAKGGEAKAAAKAPAVTAAKAPAVVAVKADGDQAIGRAA
jgi:KDO2-lipid IV(A) lauroyltransferase